MKKFLTIILGVVLLTASCSNVKNDSGTKMIYMSSGTIVYIDSLHILFVSSSTKESPVMYDLSSDTIDEGLKIEKSFENLE